MSGSAPPSGGFPVRVVRVIARLNIGERAQHAMLLAAGLDRARFATTPVTELVARGSSVGCAGLARTDARAGGADAPADGSAHGSTGHGATRPGFSAADRMADSRLISHRAGYPTGVA